MAISTAAWHAQRLPALMRGLRLPANLDVTNDDTYFDALATILEELDESVAATPRDELPSVSQRILTARGYPNEVRERAHQLSLLCCELQIARALAGRSDTAKTSEPLFEAEERLQAFDGFVRAGKTEQLVDASTSNTVDSTDARLASGVSRLCAALDVRTDDEEMHVDARTLAALIDGIRDAVEKQEISANSPLLGDNLSLTDEQKNTLDKISRTLAAEYAERRDVLVERLRLTARAFEPTHAHLKSLTVDARANAAATAVCAAVPPPPVFGAAHALSARKGLLRAPAAAHSAKADGVRALLMGAVPDRGGRVDNPEYRNPKKRGKAKRKGGNKNKLLREQLS